MCLKYRPSIQIAFKLGNFGLAGDIKGKMHLYYRREKTLQEFVRLITDHLFFLKDSRVRE